MSEAPVQYELIAISPESTVVAAFVADPSAAAAYQSEAALEAEFIRLLQVVEKLVAYFDRFFGLGSS